MVKGLRPIPLAEFGTAAWKSQREYLEQLNVTAHNNAGRKHDDYVAQAFVAHNKMAVLLHEVLVMDTWRRQILPTIRDEVVSTPTGQFMYIHYEGVLMNLMECILYQEDVVKALDEDASELLEYCWRNVADVLARKSKMHDWYKTTLVKRSPQEHMSLGDHSTKSDDKLRFHIAMSSLSCIWFIVERLGSMPMSVLNCALMKMDVILSLSEVIDTQPWLIREGGKTHKFINGEFKELSHEDSLLLCSTEAHCWFAMHYLLCDANCRRKYTYTSHRKEGLARIRKYIHEILVDQVPMLSDVQRALDELSFMQPPSNTEEKFRSSLVIEPVPRVMSAVESQIPRGGYKGLAATLRDRICNPESIREDAMRTAKMFDAMFE
jgi:hypothetical protein